MSNIPSTTKERIDEITEILAGGLMRLRAGQSSTKSREFGESSLDCVGPQRGHPEARCNA